MEKNPTDLAYQILREVVEKMQGYAARIPCESYEAAHAYLESVASFPLYDILIENESK